MVLLSGQLDQAGGLTFATVLDHLVETDRGARRTTTRAADRGRSCGPVGQRRADAAGPDGRAAAEHARPSAARRPGGPARRRGHHPGAARRRRGRRSRVTTDGTLVDRGTLTRISCDAVIDRVVLARAGPGPGHRHHRPPRHPRPAARPGRPRPGCTWPGCTTPPSLCEAHHVIWWSRGGPTTLDNLALLCHRHHTQIHAQPDDRTADGDSPTAGNDRCATASPGSDHPTTSTPSAACGATPSTRPPPPPAAPACAGHAPDGERSVTRRSA